MAVLTLGAKTYTVAPFKLRELRLAAPFIDRLAARGGRFDTLEALAEAAADMTGVLAAGVEGATPESLLAEMGLGDLDGVRAAFDAVLAEAGLRKPDAPAEALSPGEPPAGAARDP